MRKLLGIFSVLYLFNSFSGVNAAHPPIPIKQSPSAACWDIDGWFICFDN